MTNPTRQEIIEAYRELHMLVGFYEDRNPERAPRTRAIIEHVMPTLPPLTMADVEWDDDVHYLAEAEVGENKLVMLQPDLIGRIRCFDPESGKVMLAIKPDDVTPTGRRYMLTEAHDD